MSPTHLVDDAERITLCGPDQRTVTVTVCRTANDNLSFEYRRQRHIIRPDGTILQMVQFAMRSPRWEWSPVLSLPSDT